MRYLALLLLVLTTFQTYGFNPQSKPKPNSKDLQQAEIERIIFDSAKLHNATIMVKLKARAANLLWVYDQEKARKMMADLFNYVEEQKDEYFDREGARTTVFEAAISRDYNFAIELLRKTSADPKGDSQADARLARLAYGFVDDNSALAASILERSMSNGVPPTAMAAIGKLREQDPLLANNVVSKTIANLGDKPRPVAVSGLAILSSYLYPIGVYSPPDDEIRASDHSLKLLFFQISHSVLKAVATDMMEAANAERNPGMTPLTSGHLALLAATMSEMSRQFEPQLFAELNGFATKLFKDQPLAVQRLIEGQLAMINHVPSTTSGKRIDPEVEIAGALSRGDFAAADKLINEEGDSEHAKAMLQLLRRAQLKNFVAKSQLYEALGVAPKIDDIEVRLSGLIDIAKAAARLKDHDLVTTALSNIKALPVVAEKKGLRARSLFRACAELSGYSIEESLSLGREGIKVLNSLQTMTERERLLSRSPLDRLNDANGLIDSVDFNHAFIKLGGKDLATTFSTADYIEHPAVKLSARLAALKGALTTGVESSTPGKVRKS